MKEYAAYAMDAYSGMHPIRFLNFPEHMMGVGFLSNKDAMDIAIDIPGEETDKIGEIAKKYGVYIAAGSWMEKDPEYSLVFNTYPLISPEGKVILKYRKVNPWIPLEPSVSPHDLLPDYKEELFPVAKTDIGNMGLYICFDQMFPEVTRQLTFNGAEILVQCSAYMDPYGIEPTDYWTLTSRLRAMENLAYGVNCQQGSGVAEIPPFTWSGRSMIMDYEGRVLVQGDRGEQLIGTTLNIEALRHHRKTIMRHNLPAMLRTEAYSYLSKNVYPTKTGYGSKKNLKVKEIEETLSGSINRLY